MANKDIKKFLCENEGILQTDNGSAQAKIIDIELDPLDCYFGYGGYVEINTKGYSHISLSLDNLQQLKRLILEAEEYYEDFFDDEEE